MLQRKLLCVGLGVFVVCLAVAWLVFGDGSLEIARDVLLHADGREPWRLLVAVVGIAVMCAMLVPRSVLMITAGFVLSSSVVTIACCIVGASLGALTAYGIGRLAKQVGLPGAESDTPSRVRQLAARIDNWVVQRGVIGVVMARIMPGMPFGLTSYALGMSGVRWVQFAVGTVIGIVPSTVLYVALGSAILTGGLTVWLGVGAVVMAAIWIAAVRFRRVEGW